MSARTHDDAALAPAEAWFASLGWTPFEFQRDAWRAFLHGESGLIHAPTGVGKTYAAALGPMLDALHSQGTRPHPDDLPKGQHAPPVTLLWLTPLRALASDTGEALRRASDALGLGWTVELRTGDTPQSVKARQRKRLPSALVTTPESLTLLLSYADSRDLFASLRAVVVDEWHELLGTKRGVQTELALARLRAFTPGLRTWGLSATLGNLEQARDVLLGPHAANSGRLIHGAIPKPVEVDTIIPDDIARFPWAGHLGLKLLPSVVDRIESARSTLLFTNTRSQAELWHQALRHARPDWTDDIALHHGSLDRDERHATELRLHAGELRCVVATSSLDLGVDFSPVDQVIQVGSPKGVARLMQRAGRSGHRPGATSRVVCVPTHAIELVEFAAARSAIDARDIESRQPLDRPLDVLVQHLVTVALGGGFTDQELLAEVRTTHAFAALSDEEWQWCIDFVTRGGKALYAYEQFRKVQDVDGLRRVPSHKIARLHRMSIGTITSDESVAVRWYSGGGGGGGALGTVEESFISRLAPGDCFLFSGRLLEFVRLRDMTAYVRRATKPRGLVPRWGGGKLPLSTQLTAAVRDALDTYDTHDAPEMRAARPLLAVQDAWSRLPHRNELLIEHATSRDGQHFFVYPFAGRLAHEGLAALLAYRLAKDEPRSVTMTVNDYGFELLLPDPINLDEPRWRALLSTDRLVEDLLASLNASELARRQFREIARVAGLIFQGYPGAHKTTKQLHASSELLFDVFADYDPDNLLLGQARREVMERQLEVRRMRSALERLAASRLVLIHTQRLTPFAFPLWADRLQSELTTERWTDRVQRMAMQLEAQASGEETTLHEEIGLGSERRSTAKPARQRSPRQTRRLSRGRPRI